jgi:hypothetical protein
MAIFILKFPLTNFSPRFFPSLSGDLSSIKLRLVWYHVTGTLNVVKMNYRYKAAKHATAILTESSCRVAAVGHEGVQVHSTLHFNWELGREWPARVYRYFNAFATNFW